MILDPGNQCTRILTEIFFLAVKHSTKGAIHFCLPRLDPPSRDARGRRDGLDGASKDVLAWAKPKALPGCFYSSQCELIFVFQNGDASPQGTLKRRTARRSNLWKYAGSDRADRLDAADRAVNAKPVRLVADALRDCSRKGDVALYSFVGTGATILAAERAGRCAYSLELDPRLVDVAIRGWQAVTKQHASLVGSGASFNEVMAQRSSSEIGRAK